LLRIRDGSPEVKERDISDFLFKQWKWPVLNYTKRFY